MKLSLNPVHSYADLDIRYDLLLSQGPGEKSADKEGVKDTKKKPVVRGAAGKVRHCSCTVLSLVSLYDNVHLKRSIFYC